MSTTSPTSPPSAPSSARFSYIAGIDGIRGFWVVLGPLMYHAKPDVIPGGILGIDLFFVLSSYLITSIALAEWDRSGRIDLMAYAGRRARRLLPALFFCLGLLVVYLCIYRESLDVSRWTGAIIATLTYSANWFEISSQVSYFQQFEFHPLRHVWSFAIEEQFYIFAPLFLIAALRWGKHHGERVILVVTSIGAVLSALLMSALYHGGDPSRVYYGTDTRAHSLLVGMAFAVIVRMYGPVRTEVGRKVLVAGAYLSTGFFFWAVFNITERTEWMFDYGGFLGVAIISAFYVLGVSQASAGSFPRALATAPRTIPVRVLAGAGAAATVVVVWIIVNFLNGGSTADHLIYVVPAAGTAAVYGASLPNNGPLHWFLEARPVRWVGKISYGLYLYHWPIYLLVTPERASRWLPGDRVISGNSLVVVHIALTFALATFSWYVVEQPVSQRRFPVVRRPLLPTPAALVGSAAVIAIFAGLLIANSNRPAVADEGRAVEVILPPGVGPDDRILVIGDSIAVQIGEELKNYARDHPGQVVVWNEAHVGCSVGRYGQLIQPGFDPGPVGDACSAWNDPVDPQRVVDPEVISWPTAIEVFQPTIVIGHITPWDVTDRQVPSLGDQYTWVGRPDYDAYIQSEYRLATEVLGSRGAQVYWLLGSHLNKPPDPGNDPARIDRLNELVQAATADLDFVTFLDYPGFVGPIGTERELQTRDDGVHLSAQGLAEVVPWLLDQVGIAAVTTS